MRFNYISECSVQWFVKIQDLCHRRDVLCCSCCDGHHHRHMPIVLWYDESSAEWACRPCERQHRGAWRDARAHFVDVFNFCCCGRRWDINISCNDCGANMVSGTDIVMMMLSLIAVLGVLLFESCCVSGKFVKVMPSRKSHWSMVSVKRSARRVYRCSSPVINGSYMCSEI